MTEKGSQEKVGQWITERWPMWRGPDGKDSVHSNLGGRVEGAEDALKAGQVWAYHYAREFCGHVWFENGEFHEEVWRYSDLVDRMSAPTLNALIEKVNEKWGCE